MTLFVEKVEKFIIPQIMNTSPVFLTVYDTNTSPLDQMLVKNRYGQASVSSYLEIFLPKYFEYQTYL